MPYILFFILVACMVACHIIAKNKGRNPIAWGVTGAIFGPFAILILMLMPKLN